MAKRILIVDDSKTICSLLERSLCSVGFEVTCCVRAQYAIELIEEEDYDLVITDILMPDMDGFEFISYIKSHLPVHPPPIIAISGGSAITATGGAILESVKGLANSVLSKPFSKDDLLFEVSKYI